MTLTPTIQEHLKGETPDPRKLAADFHNELLARQHELIINQRYRIRALETRQASTLATMRDHLQDIEVITEERDRLASQAGLGLQDLEQAINRAKEVEEELEQTKALLRKGVLVASWMEKERPSRWGETNAAGFLKEARELLGLGPDEPKAADVYPPLTEEEAEEVKATEILAQAVEAGQTDPAELAETLGEIARDENHESTTITRETLLEAAKTLGAPLPVSEGSSLNNVPRELIFDGDIDGCTVRSCWDCGALVAGGPTRCVLCAERLSPKATPLEVKVATLEGRIGQRDAEDLTSRQEIKARFDDLTARVHALEGGSAR